MNNKKLSTLFGLLAFTFAVTCIFNKATYAEEHISADVLILNSYHQGYAWSDAIVKGIVDTLATHGDITFHIEYMDTKRFSGDAYLEQLATIYKHKFYTSPPDVIISSDDNALNFLIAHQQDLFTGIPIVFCGVNNYHDLPLLQHSNITGVIEAYDLRGNFDLIQTMHPRVTNIVAVLDSTTSSKVNKLNLQEIAEEYKSILSVDYIDDVSTEELLEQLGQLTDGDAVLFLSFFKDNRGRVYSLEESTALVSQHSPVPVYSIWDSFILSDVIGGRVVSGFHQGEVAGMMANRILNGESVETIPIEFESPNVVMFNQPVLKKYGFHINNLPEDSILLNYQPSFYKKHHRLIWSAIALIIFETILIMVLLFNLIKRRRAEHSLRISETRLQLALNATNDGLWDYDVKTGNTYFSPRWYTVLGYAPYEWPQHYDTWANLLHPDERERVEAELQKHIADKTDFVDMEYRMRTKSGTYKWIQTRGKIAEWDRNGNATRLVGTHVDITDRIAAQKALKKSEKRFRMLVESIPNIAVQGYDINRNVIFWNPASENLYGFSAEEAIGRKIEELIIPARMKTKVIQSIRDWAEKDVPIPAGELVLIDKDHHDVPVFSSHVMLLNKEGERELYCIDVDLRERHRAEAARQQSEEQFRQVVEHSPLAIALLNQTGNFDYLNHRFVETFGYSLDEMSSLMEWLSLACQDEHCKQEVMTQWQTITRQDNVDAQSDAISQEWRITCKNGTTKFVEFYYTPLGEKGILVINDITERRKAEDALRKSESNFQSMAANVPGVLFRLQVRDNGERSFIYISPRCEEIFGFTVDDVLYDWGVLQFHVDDGLRFEKSINSAIDSHHDLSFEGRVLATSNEWKWVRITGKPVQGPDVVVINGIIIDITASKQNEKEREQLEAQVRQAQKLESLGLLAGGIAHDFNNLLMGILGNAGLALDELSQTASARVNVEEIEIAAKCAADLCRQMLAYSGKGRFVVELVDLNKIVDEMAHLLEVSISKKTSITYNYADTPTMVEADVTQLRQVIMNLITNASDALENEDGAISISTGIMYCDADYLKTTWLKEDLREGDYAYLEVSDTGCGMTDDTMERIFDPFFTTKFTGRGLGMAAVIGIIRGHRGTMRIESEPNKGSRFKVLFPAQEASTDEAVQHVKELKQWRGEGVVLLVDDDEIIRQVAKRMLKKMGFEVLLAVSGEEALTQLEDNKDRITCILLDLTMPGMDGEEAFRELKNIKQDVKIILSSGYNEQDIVERFIGRGLAGFIQKPYQTETLAAELKRILAE